MTQSDLTHLCIEYDEPGFRGNQLFNWIYSQKERDIMNMKNLPKLFRDSLSENYRVSSFSEEYPH